MSTAVERGVPYAALSPSAQATARDHYRENRLQVQDWYEFTYNDWKEKLSELGFTNAEIQFQGFGCQGHGASFTSEIERSFPLPENLATELREAEAVAKVLLRFEGKPAVVFFHWSMSASINRSPHTRYVHECSIDAEISTEEGDDIPADLAQRLHDWAQTHEAPLTKEARQLSHQIYLELEREWDYQNSDDTIAEALEDYTFNENGTLL